MILQNCLFKTLRNLAFVKEASVYTRVVQLLVTSIWELMGSSRKVLNELKIKYINFYGSDIFTLSYPKIDLKLSLNFIRKELYNLFQVIELGHQAASIQRAQCKLRRTIISARGMHLGSYLYIMHESLSFRRGWRGSVG